MIHAPLSKYPVRVCNITSLRRQMLACFRSIRGRIVDRLWPPAAIAHVTAYEHFTLKHGKQPVDCINSLSRVLLDDLGAFRPVTAFAVVPVRRHRNHTSSSTIACNSVTSCNIGTSTGFLASSHRALMSTPAWPLNAIYLCAALSQAISFRYTAKNLGTFGG